MTSEVDLGKRERGSDLVEEEEEVDLGRKVGSDVDLGRNEESAGVLEVDLKIGSVDKTEVVLKKRGGCEVLL